MPTPERPNPLQPAPWLQDLVRDRPVAPVTPEVKPEVKVEAPVVPSTVVPDLKKEISNIDEKAIDAEPAPSLDKAAPVVTGPLSTEVTQGTPAATAPVAPAVGAPTIPLSPAK